MNKKVILGCMLLALTTCAFAEEKQKAGASKPVKMTKEDVRAYETIRGRWKEFLVWIPENVTTEELALESTKAVIEKNEKAAEVSYGKLNLEKDRKFLINGFDNLGNGVHVQKSYEELLKIAKGYATPGSKFYKNEEVKKNILDGLEWMYSNAYHEGLPENGNWWQWEIGIPKILNNILTIMYSDMPRKDLIKYLKASEYFQPNPRFSGMSPGAQHSSAPHQRVSTGGNRLDTAMISFVRGTLMQDKKQVLDAVNCIGDVGEYVTSGDGFYRDGSFIQHESVAYSGTYASVLFNGLGSILWLASGTEFEVKDKRIENVYEAILNSYNYLMINGGVNDSVSGRSISRNNSNEIERGKGLIGSYGLLIEGAPAQYKEGLKRLTKTVILENNYYNPIEKLNNVLIKKILRSVVADPKVEPLKVEGAKVFAAMDRAVYKNKKGGKVALSMHSSRIANYETMNGENVQGWYTGDGMMYIYGQDSETYINYWPTVDMYHLPGVTNSLAIRENRSGERRTKDKVSPKDFVGGVQGKDKAFLGMDMLSWNDKTEVKKSYLMTDDVVLVVGSNLNSEDGLVHTTIDNRILKDGKIYVNGKLLTGDKEIRNPKNVTINFTGNSEGENIGYKVISGPELVIKTTDNVGSWEKIGGKDKKEIEKKYFTMYLNHGENPKDNNFAYVVMPMSNQKDVEKFDTTRFEILKNDTDAHVIRDKKNNMTAYNFWKDEVKKAVGVKSYSTLSLMVEDKGEEKVLYVSEPAQLQKPVSTLELDGKYELIETTDPAAKLTVDGKITKLELDLRNNGSTQRLVLKKIK